MPTLYWKNISTDNAWENPINWFTNAAATIPAANVPWLDGTDTTYLAYDLTLADGETSSLIMDVNYLGLNFGTGVTGSCDIVDLYNNTGSIFGGTFTGENFSNSSDGSIFGGTFTGDGFYNNTYYGNIYDGTFTGDGFNNNGDINGGTFIGENFNNTGEIDGGTFIGENFNNSGGSIFGGTFTGENFSNSGGNIYGGTYSPSGTASLTQSSGTTFSVSLSVLGDPGFANGGGGYSPVITTVIDNLTAPNIKSGVTILGVAGTASSGGGGGGSRLTDMNGGF